MTCVFYSIDRQIYSGFWLTTYYGGPLSLGPVPSGRLKNPRDLKKGSFLRLSLSVTGM